MTENKIIIKKIKIIITVGIEKSVGFRVGINKKKSNENHIYNET